VLLALLVACTTVPTVEPTESPASPASGETIVVALPIPAFAMAPFALISNATQLRASIHPELTSRLVYSALYRYDDELLPVPDLASEPCDVDDGGLTITCKLTAATFHDGVPMTADDVAYTYEIGRRALTATGDCVFAFGLCLSDLLESATAVDDTTVQFRLTRPDATFETLVMPDVLIHSRRHVEAAYAQLAERASGLDPVDYEAAAAAIDEQLQSDEPDCITPVGRAEELLEAAGVEPYSHDLFALADGSLNECLYADWLGQAVADIGSSLRHTGLDAIARAYRVLSFNRAPIGTGPFRYAGITDGPRVRVEAYPSYHHGAPAAPAIEVVVMRDVDAAQQALLSGDIHWLPIRDVLPEVYDELRNEPQLQFARYLSPSYLTLIYNMREGMLFADRNLRAALELCIDKPATVDTATAGHGEPIYSLIPPASWAYHSDLAAPGRDVAAARALIEESGWTEGEDGVYGRDGERLSTEVFVTAEDTQRLAFMELTAEQALDCGIEITVVPADSETVLGPLEEYPHVPGNRSEPFEAHFIGWLQGYDPADAGLLLHSDFVTTEEQPIGTNISGYSNERVDELLDAGISTFDDRERARIYRELQEVVADDHPMLFAWATRSHEAMTARLDYVDGDFNLSSPHWFWRLERLVLRSE
jgi:ABC-type transport system substrate-binding protein